MPVECRLTSLPCSRHSTAAIDHGGMSRAEMIKERITPLWTTDRMARRQKKAFAADIEVIRRATEPRTLNMMIKKLQEKGRAAHTIAQEQKWDALIKLVRSTAADPPSNALHVVRLFVV